MAVQRHTGRFGRLSRVVTGWPRLFIAAGIALAVVAGGVLFGARPVTAMLIGWDAGVVFFFVAVLQLISTADPADIRRNAARQDVGQFVVLTLTAIAALASVGAIYAEVSLSSGRPTTAWRLGPRLLTIVLSWFFVHAIFAVHYAHEYLRAGRGERRGSTLPGRGREPDYWDFIYFALVIGMTAQVVGRRGHQSAAAHGRCSPRVSSPSGSMSRFSRS